MPATGTPTYPGPSNMFLPSFSESGRLQVEFSRNPKSFPINTYCGMKTTKKDNGNYLRITAEQAARILSQQAWLWNDGAPAPDGNWNTEKFEWPSFQCERRLFPWALGTRGYDMADFDVGGVHNRLCAQQAMTARTMRALDVLLTSGNWSSSNTGTATAAGGGIWTGSTAANAYINKAFDAVKLAVHKATLGVVKGNNLVCVISPTLAHIMRETEEIKDFIKQSPIAAAAIMGTEFFAKWSLPEQLYGVRLTVEDTVKVTSKKGATLAATYAMDSTKAVFVYAPDSPAAKGGDTTVEEYSAGGAPTFSTMTLFVKEDMAVETMTDTNNRRINGRVVDDTAEELTAPASGYLLTGCS